LAWIRVKAWAGVNSGVNLHPLSKRPATKKTATPKTFKFNAFFTFPPYTVFSGLICVDPPFLPYFPGLSMVLEMTVRTSAQFPSEQAHIFPEA
jgi:hypothetical protein